MRLLAALSAAFAVCTAFASAQTAPLEIIKECAGRVKPPTKGIIALTARCPELQDALGQLGLTETLAHGWREELTPNGLRDLAALAARYQRGSARAAPDVSSLRGILDQLARERIQPPRSWWDIAKDWLRSLFSAADEHSLSWLDRWLVKLASAAVLFRWILYGSVAAVLIAAVGFIVLELRSTGVWVIRNRRRSVAMKTRSMNAPMIASGELTSLDAASALDRPAILLRLLVRSLSAGGRLMAERHLTHRELAGSAVFDGPTERQSFAQVADVAEELLYGPKLTSPEQADRVVRDGRALLLLLESSRTRPTRTMSQSDAS